MSSMSCWTPSPRTTVWTNVERTIDSDGRLAIELHVDNTILDDPDNILELSIGMSHLKAQVNRIVSRIYNKASKSDSTFERLMSSGGPEYFRSEMHRRLQSSDLAKRLNFSVVQRPAPPRVETAPDPRQETSPAKETLRQPSKGFGSVWRENQGEDRASAEASTQAESDHRSEVNQDAATQNESEQIPEEDHDASSVSSGEDRDFW